MRRQVPVSRNGALGQGGAQCRSFAHRGIPPQMEVGLCRSLRWCAKSRTELSEATPSISDPAGFARSSSGPQEARRLRRLKTSAFSMRHRRTSTLKSCGNGTRKRKYGSHSSWSSKCSTLPLLKRQRPNKRPGLERTVVARRTPRKTSPTRSSATSKRSGTTFSSNKPTGSGSTRVGPLPNQLKVGFFYL